MADTTPPPPLSEEEIAELDHRLTNACAEHVKWGHPGSAAVVLKDHELGLLLASARRAAALEAFLAEHADSVESCLEMALDDIESEFGVNEEHDEATVALEAFRKLRETR